MTDLRPLLDDGATPLEAELLREARDVAPVSASLQRSMIALGVSAAAISTLATGTRAAAQATAASTGAASAGATSIGPMLAKYLILGGLTGLGAVGAVAGARALQEPPRPASVGVVAPSASVRPETSKRNSTEPAAPKTEASEPTAPSPTTRLLEEAPAPVTGGATERAQPTSTLGQEVVLVDRARAALAAGDARGALGALGEYRSAFPSGELSGEAAYLHVATLARLGDWPAAEAVGAKILARDPNGPQAKRVRRLLDARGR